MNEEETEQQPGQQDSGSQHAHTDAEMCCDDSGRTAEEHRAQSDDGKCCVDA